KDRMEQMWQLLFPEIPRENLVIVRFKGKWKNKFGHIKKIKGLNTEIAINSIFKDDRVPDYIIDLTLAHEMVHYMHGFNSPLPKQFKHPHAGGIVNRELKKRGFGHLIVKEKAWVKKDWEPIFKDYVKPREYRPRSFGFFRW
ncbi:MAG: hypothetical protein Q8L27_02705, partial [archaeon]|nr:hypothetical protein [archaeon]